MLTMHKVCQLGVIKLINNNSISKQKCFKHFYLFHFKQRRHVDQELVIRHDDDPLWEVFIRFDDKKKLTAQAYSNVDNDYMYDAVLEYVDEVI